MSTQKTRNMRSKLSATTALVSLSILALAGASGTAYAADATAGKDQGNAVETVVVTAEFRQENLQQTPIAITAITAADLEARGQTSLADVAAEAPNVILRPNPQGSGHSMSAFIRGIGQSDLDPAVDPGVGVYIDDVYYSSLTGSDLALLDIDRVEILRGPQGTLAGMNSLGGSVKVYSKKPDDAGGGYLDASYGNYSTLDVRAGADFTVIPDKLFFRVSGVARRSDGYVTRYDYACVHPNDPFVLSGALPHGGSDPGCKLGTEGGIDYEAERAALRWTPTSNFEVNVSVDATQDNSEVQAQTLLRAYPVFFVNPLAYQGVPFDSRFVPYGAYRGDTVKNNAYITYANFLDPGVTYTPIDTAGSPGAPNGAQSVSTTQPLSAWGAAGSIDWTINDTLSLKSISSYRQFSSADNSDPDGSPVVILQEAGMLTHNQFTQELRLNGSAFGPLLEYPVGGYYLTDKTVYQTRENDPFLGFYGTPTMPTFDFVQDDPVRNRIFAAFAHTAWHITDDLTLDAGIRYTDQRKAYTFNRLNVGGRLNADGTNMYLPLSNPGNPLNGTVGLFEGSHVDYRADINYQWTPDLMTYAEFSTGFKGGGITPRPYFPQQAIPFGPETMTAYEIGAKSEWWDRRLRANLALFYEEYNGYQAGATSSTCVDIHGNPLPPQYANPCGEYRNVADAESKGVEAEIEAIPIDGLQIDTSISYLDFKFTKTFDASIKVGQTPPNIGDFRWSVGAQYEIGLDDLGSLTPRLDIVHTPGSCGDLTCTPIIKNDSYTLLNFRLTYQPEATDWKLAVEVTNLTDKLYYLEKFDTGIGYTAGEIAPPREVLFTISKRF